MRLDSVIPEVSDGCDVGLGGGQDEKDLDGGTDSVPGGADTLVGRGSDFGNVGTGFGGVGIVSVDLKPVSVMIIVARMTSYVRIVAKFCF